MDGGGAYVQERGHCGSHKGAGMPPPGVLSLQECDDGGVVPFAGTVQGGLAIFVLRSFVRSRLQQTFHHFCVTVISCIHQGGNSIVVCEVHIGSFSNQK